jgi:hypothetical protein
MLQLLFPASINKQRYFCVTYLNKHGEDGTINFIVWTLRKKELVDAHV